MKSIAEGLPAEVAQHIHPDWYKNEADYWAVRDRLLPQYENQWVAFSEGEVIASDKRPSVVFRTARGKAKYPFVTCVGLEHVGFRMRRAVFAYDRAYPGEAIPVIQAEFRRDSSCVPTRLDQVILDTGADVCALPWSDCQTLQLDPDEGLPSIVTGVTGVPAMTMSFELLVALDGNEYPCEVQVDYGGNERILGRNVLNYLDVLFRGPAEEVVINP